MKTKEKQLLLKYLASAEERQELDPGGIDGIEGRRTRAAMTAFEKAWGSGTDADLKKAVYQGLVQKETDSDGLDWEEVTWFTREEFRCPCGKCGGFPVEPQPGIVREMQALRVYLGVPVIIVPPDGHSGGSGVRCKEYNATLPGSVPNSLHLEGRAADFKAPLASDATIGWYLTRRKAAGKIRYWYKINAGSFHVDV